MSTLSNPVILGVQKLAHARELALPAYETDGAAGMDLRAACSTSISIAPGTRSLVPTGLILEIPAGYEGQIRPRSGLAMKHGITCLNTPGTIDADYRGEVMVLLINHGEEDFIVEHGMRIAQLVIAPVTRTIVEMRTESSSTKRDSGGFGSTGV